MNRLLYIFSRYTILTKKLKKVIRCFYGEYVHGLNSLWIKIFRRPLLNDNNIRMDETLRRAEDKWFIFEALKVSDVFSYIKDNLYYYYQN